MKKWIAMLLALVMLLALCACGDDDRKENSRNDNVSVNDEDPGETTLSPREQFAQMQEAMEELNKKDEEEEVVSAAFTTNGITYTLDSSFTAQNEGSESTQHTYISDTIQVTVDRFDNIFDYSSSEELAEAFASQKDGREIGSRNGVFYVDDLNTGFVRGYYVDDSGYYWIISAFFRNGSDYETGYTQLIEICTSGKIN